MNFKNPSLLTYTLYSVFLSIPIKMKSSLFVSFHIKILVIFTTCHIDNTSDSVDDDSDDDGSDDFHN